MHSIAHVGNYMLKYNFESNSQPDWFTKKVKEGWELYAKVQFWKQFTTKGNIILFGAKLGIIC